MPRHLLLRCSLALLVASLTPQAASGQGWAVGLGWSFLDHDPPANVAEDGEEVPPGLGAFARYTMRDSHLFIQADLSYGTDARTGAVCGGFVGPDSCVPERVGYSGGILGASVGWWMGPADAPAWAVHFVPRVGAAMLGAWQRGRSTGRTHSEVRLAAGAGASIELARRVARGGPVVLLSAGAELFAPIPPPSCEDCWVIFDGRLPRYTAVLGLEW